MDISVILCTWNNAARLDITLSSFLEIKVPKGASWELVVVDNNSNDGTRDTISGYLKKLPIQYVKEPIQGLSYARNAGLRTAEGKLIIFTDDDVKPGKEWLSTYWKAYKNNPGGYFWGGPIESEFETYPEDMELIRLAPCSVKGLDWGEHRKALNFDKGEYFIGANWGCPYSAFQEAGHFNLNLGLNPSSGKIRVGEETEFMKRLISCGWRPIYLPKAKIHHYVPASKMSLSHIASRAEAYGRTLAKEDESHDVRLLFGVPRWMWLRLFVLWKNYLIKKITGKMYYRDYLSFRCMIGEIKCKNKFFKN